MNAYIEHYDIMIWGNNVVDVAVSGWFVIILILLHVVGVRNILLVNLWVLRNYILILLYRVIYGELLILLV